MTVPGVGPITPLTIPAEVGDLCRLVSFLAFPTSRPSCEDAFDVIDRLSKS